MSTQSSFYHGYRDQCIKMGYYNSNDIARFMYKTADLIKQGEGGWDKVLKYFSTESGKEVRDALIGGVIGMGAGALGGYGVGGGRGAMMGGLAGLLGGAGIGGMYGKDIGGWLSGILGDKKEKVKDEEQIKVPPSEIKGRQSFKSVFSPSEVAEMKNKLYNKDKATLDLVKPKDEKKIFATTSGPSVLKSQQPSLAVASNRLNAFPAMGTPSPIVGPGEPLPTTPSPIVGPGEPLPTTPSPIVVPGELLPITPSPIEVSGEPTSEGVYSGFAEAAAQPLLRTPSPIITPEKVLPGTPSPIETRSMTVPTLNWAKKIFQKARDRTPTTNDFIAKTMTTPIFNQAKKILQQVSPSTTDGPTTFPTASPTLAPVPTINDLDSVKKIFEERSKKIQQESALATQQRWAEQEKEKFMQQRKKMKDYQGPAQGGFLGGGINIGDPLKTPLQKFLPHIFRTAEKSGLGGAGSIPFAKYPYKRM